MDSSIARDSAVPRHCSRKASRQLPSCATRLLLKVRRASPEIGHASRRRSLHLPSFHAYCMYKWGIASSYTTISFLALNFHIPFA